MLSKEALAQLFAAAEAASVSIYMPTYRTGREAQQNGQRDVNGGLQTSHGRASGPQAPSPGVPGAAGAADAVRERT